MLRYADSPLPLPAMSTSVKATVTKREYPTGTTAGDGTDVTEIEETAEVVLEAKLVRRPRPPPICHLTPHCTARSWAHAPRSGPVARSGARH